ncbi:MAG: DUF835 domain-containing protein [Thermoplasmata archaeon]|nr:MAG: DUF835 domain-containing protein [Thermoplasmata archaeon]
MSLDLFLHEVEEGVPSLLVSHIPPYLLMGGLDHKSQKLFENVVSVWLTSHTGDGCIKLSDLDQLADRTVHFIESHHVSIVLLEGIGDLVIHNDFQSVMHSLHRIMNSLSEHNSTLIVPIEPSAFEHRDLDVLERHMMMIWRRSADKGACDIQI